MQILKKKVLSVFQKLQYRTFDFFLSKSSTLNIKTKLGVIVGLLDGVDVTVVGKAVPAIGLLVGLFVGLKLGLLLGEVVVTLGLFVGLILGLILGAFVLEVGFTVGSILGKIVGFTVNIDGGKLPIIGLSDGLFVGFVVGVLLGKFVFEVGFFVGFFACLNDFLTVKTH